MTGDAPRPLLPSSWAVRGGPHLLAVGTVLFVLLVAGTVATVDLLRTTARQRTAIDVTGRIAATLTIRLLHRADAAAAPLLRDPDRFDLRSFRMRVENDPGLRRVQVLRPDGSLLAEAGAAAPAGAMADPAGIMLADEASAGAAGPRLRLTVDRFWLLEHFSTLIGDGAITLVLSQDGRILAQEGGAAIRRPGGGVLPGCLCASIALPGRSLRITAGTPHAIVLRPWIRDMGWLVAATLVTVSALAAFSVRLDRQERRDAHRLQHLADGAARLTEARNRAVLFDRLAADAGALLGRFATGCVVEAAGTGGWRGRCFPLATSDGRNEHRLVVTTRGDRRLPPREEAGVERLVFTAAHMLDGIMFAERREDELLRATALREASEQARTQIEAMFSAIPDAVMAVDAEWRPLLRNDAARRLLPEDGDRAVWAALPAAVRAEVEAPLREAMAARGEVSRRVRWAADPGSRTGERWFVLRGVGHAAGMVLSLREVTHEIAQESGRAQAAKLEALGLLTGGIAHDFNNLLTVVIGNLEAIELIGGAVEADDTVITDSLHAARSAAELTHQLLAFARRQPLAPTAIDVDALLREMLGLLRSSVGPAIAIRIETGGDCRHALADRVQLQNALLNLAFNARDAMPDGGELRIGVDGLSMAHGDPVLAAQELAAGEYVRIVVADTGSGIAQEDLGRVFEPFFTTKPGGAGTGLGLSMVYGFVRQSRGGVLIDSVPGRGTRIALFLPVAGPRREQDAPAVEPLPLGAGERILLVEDVAPVRQQTARVLRRLNYVVAEAADGPEALEAVARNGAPALLLTDLKLTGPLDGRQLAERVRAIAPEVGLLFITGYAGEIALGGLIVPGRNMLSKPFSIPGLAAHVRDALRDADAADGTGSRLMLERSD